MDGCAAVGYVFYSLFVLLSPTCIRTGRQRFPRHCCGSCVFFFFFSAEGSIWIVKEKTIRISRGFSYLFFYYGAHSICSETFNSADDVVLGSLVFILIFSFYSLNFCLLMFILLLGRQKAEVSRLHAMKRRRICDLVCLSSANRL